MKVRSVLGSCYALILLLFLTACQVTPEPGESPGPPTLPNLPAGQWAAFSPGGETACADGSPYAFYVYPGTVNKVVIDFEGGGACWSGATCGEGGPFQPNIPNPAGRLENISGIYDKTNAENPVKDWYHVFVSYCTADVHLGDAVQTYATPTGEQVIQHNGQKNVAAVLGWVFDAFSAPESVLVTGCSAGAYGAALYTPAVAEHYPEAGITQLGDCGAGIVPETFVTSEDGLRRWNIGAVLPEGVDVTEGIPSTFLADAYIAIGDAYPEVTLAQYNSLLDSVQITFYGLMLGLDLDDPAVLEQTAREWLTGLSGSIQRIKAGLPEAFSSYTSLLDDNDNLQDGTLHCILSRPEFYILTTSDVSFVGWLDELINGTELPAEVTPPLDALPFS